MLTQTRTQHKALVQDCEVECPRLDASLRTDMDQIISSKEHVTGRMRGKSRLVNVKARLKGFSTNHKKWLIGMKVGVQTFALELMAGGLKVGALKSDLVCLN